MNYRVKKSLQVIGSHCSQFVPPLMAALAEAGLTSFPSFDLRSARASHEGCICPNHGTIQCSCELVVLLVYRPDGDPITLVLDGCDGKAYVSVNDETGSAVPPSILEAVKQAVIRAAGALKEIDQD